MYGEKKKALVPSYVSHVVNGKARKNREPKPAVEKAAARQPRSVKLAASTKPAKK